MNVYVEAVGSLTCGWLIKSIQNSGNQCIASDANPDAVGRYLADDFCVVPFATDNRYTDSVLDIIDQKEIGLIIPTLDDSLLKWDAIRDLLKKKNVSVALSEHDSLITCLDKWKTYVLFETYGIPTPKTSLTQEYRLVKPRNGRGGSGVQIVDHPVDMTNMISQEVLIGDEYTVDVFFDIENVPVYIVPRKRLTVKEGKSTGGEVCYRPDIEELVWKISKHLRFTGAINLQCFDTPSGLKVTEINPRFGGGSPLGMRATENWIPLTVDTFCKKKKVRANNKVEYGLKMGRYYAEVFYR